MLDRIFEDETILVLSKPPGQIVNRAETTVGETTLQDELENYFGIAKASSAEGGTSFGIQKSEDGIGGRAGIGRLGSAEPSNSGLGIGGRAGIVHRLDKETSGILVVAKTPEAFERLQAQFKVREVEKEYLALVHGETPREGRIEEPIGRIPKLHGHFGVVEGGRESMTEYRREALYGIEEEKYSFLRVHPRTGRTHQIRVHLKHIGHPVVADPLYLSDKRLKADLEFCPRLFLHAASLAFTHPSSGARMRFEAELPVDLQKALAGLKITTDN
ncbi:MAG: RluA family pseudouridine synthase [Patescibacteria group bacterium]